MALTEDDLAHCDWPGVVMAAGSTSGRLTLCVNLPDEALLMECWQFVDNETLELDDC